MILIEEKTKKLEEFKKNVDQTDLEHIKQLMDNLGDRTTRIGGEQYNLEERYQRTIGYVKENTKRRY